MDERFNDVEERPEYKPLRGSNINEVIAAYNAGRPMIAKSDSQKFAIEKFMPILEYVQELDFLILAYAENPKTLQRIQMLRKEETDYDLSQEERKDAGIGLKAFEPKDKQKLIMVIEELISNLRK